MTERGPLPVRKIGRIAIRKGPIAHLSDVQADALLANERDLRQAPTPISGGMRKALKKEAAKQASLRFRTGKPFRTADVQRSYGLMMTSCPRCRHVHFFDEVDFDDALRCDRCKRSLWQP